MIDFLFGEPSPAKLKQYAAAIMKWNNRRSQTHKCNNCGKFIPMEDFFEEKASRRLITPLSDFTKEEFETLCKNCND